MSINKIALIGATGNLGPAIHKGLLDGGYSVTILSREGSTSTDSLPSHPKQQIKKVNFDDVNSIAAALDGIEGLVSNVASHALGSQTKIIDAAVAAGVKRFVPSDFGSDLDAKANSAVPFNQPKIEIHRYLEETVKKHPEFTWTSVCNGPFFDWCLKMGLIGNLKTHEMTLWDGGDTKVSTTTLPSVGKTVAAVFRNLDVTKNTTVRVADTTISQKEIMALVKEIDGKEWTTTLGNTAEAYQAGLDEFKKPNPNFEMAIVNQLYRIIFCDEFGTNMEGKLDNEKLGLKGLTREEVKEVIRGCMPA